ncbi:MAG: hypothetical protein ACI9FR_001021 [Cryomorphaceae bacterium]|jgi:hypothetical protein
MTKSANRPLEKVAFFLVLLMALLQGAYAIYAYSDPSSFSLLRGTELHDLADADWVKIYASRTWFVALIIGFLLYLKNYQILAWAALFGTVMPVADAFLAYQAGAADAVVYKHIATFVYLLITFAVLKVVVKNHPDD